MAVNASIQLQTKLKSDHIVVIPVNLLQSLLESNIKQQEAIKHLSDTMEKFVTEFFTRMENETLSDQLSNSTKMTDATTASSDGLQHKILAKLDELSRYLASHNQLKNNSVETDLKKSANRRKTLLSKIRRAEQLSQYYSELITRNDPFVPRMFRTKVNGSTPDFEKPAHKDMAITRVKNEINLMVGRVKHWRNELGNLESSINTAVASLDESKRFHFFSRLSKDEENVERNRALSFDKIRRSYEKEMDTFAFDKELYLLSVEKKKRHMNNYQGPSQLRYWKYK